MMRMLFYLSRAPSVLIHAHLLDPSASSLMMFLSQHAPFLATSFASPLITRRRQMPPPPPPPPRGSSVRDSREEDKEEEREAAASSCWRRGTREKKRERGSREEGPAKSEPGTTARRRQYRVCVGRASAIRTRQYCVCVGSASAIPTRQYCVCIGRYQGGASRYASLVAAHAVSV
eukprot:429119-Rhodomonas_salina.3